MSVDLVTDYVKCQCDTRSKLIENEAAATDDCDDRFSTPSDARLFTFLYRRLLALALALGAHIFSHPVEITECKIIRNQQVVTIDMSVTYARKNVFSLSRAAANIFRWR